MNWIEIADGVRAKVVDLVNPQALVVFRVPGNTAAIAMAQLADDLADIVPGERFFIIPDDMDARQIEPDTMLNPIAAKAHTVWMAEKQRQGFADHTFVEAVGGYCFVPTCMLAADKHHADMLPFDDLPEHVKDYDRATVRAVLAALIEEDTP